MTQPGIEPRSPLDHWQTLYSLGQWASSKMDIIRYYLLSNFIRARRRQSWNNRKVEKKAKEKWKLGERNGERDRDENKIKVERENREKDQRGDGLKTKERQGWRQKTEMKR